MFVSLLPASSASAAYPFGDWDSLISGHTINKCLEVADWSEGNGAAVRQWKCSGGANQKWQGRAAPGDDPYTAPLYNQNSGKCLEIADWSRSDGAPARQWDCTGGANQKWVFTFSGSKMVMKNVHSQKCLEIAAWSEADGAPARQWTCTGGLNQAWF
ncbi:RICIN domain-containing protein [Streptomyces agglomeratus]|uniref:RICIN domain-containing protein n=1 Tax=Streptomyces agglomeratus TaxID=285458 RepID=UPI0034E5D82F